MKILVTGKGGAAGSWQIRGEQLGRALGATVKPLATYDDIRTHDLVVVVKRVPDVLLDSIKAAGKPWLFDCVDFYPQPVCSAWSRAQAIAWVRERLAYYSPDGVIWPNVQMMADCERKGVAGTVLYHHHRPRIVQNPIRETVRNVGYEGCADYLQGWARVIESECRVRGWQFVINPDNLADVDIVVAFRGEGYAGYAQSNWKSNVKMANAHGSGTPFVCQSECGYLEQKSGCEYFADSAKQLREAFRALTPQSTREQVASRFLECAYPVEAAASSLRRFINGL